MFQPPLRRANLQDDATSLMTDVWTFMAILGLCLSVIFALVQSLPFAAEGNRPLIQGQELTRMELDSLTHRQEQLKSQVRELRSEADRLRDELEHLAGSERISPAQPPSPVRPAAPQTVSTPAKGEPAVPLRTETDTIRTAMLLARLNDELSAARDKIQDLEAQVDRTKSELQQALAMLERRQPHQPIPEETNPLPIRTKTASAEQMQRDVAAELERLNQELEAALEQRRATADQHRAAREERDAALSRQVAELPRPTSPQAPTPRPRASEPSPASTTMRSDPAPQPGMETGPMETESITREQTASRHLQPEQRDQTPRTPVATPSSESPPATPAPRNDAQGFTLRFASEQALTRVLLRNEAQFYLIAGGRAWKLRNPGGSPSFQPAEVREKLYEMHRNTVPDSYLAASRAVMVSGGGTSFHVALSNGIQRQLRTLTAGASGGSLIIHADGRVTLE